MMAVYLKELLDNFRDRRVVLITLILGPLLGPAAFVALIAFTTQQSVERAQAALELPVVGAERAPQLIGFLERHGVTIQPPPENPEAAIRDEEEEVVLRIGEGFAAAWQAGRSAPVEIITDRSLRYTEASVNRVNEYLQSYNRQMGHLRLQLRGVHPELTEPLQPRVVDLSTPESRGGLVLAILPYLVLIAVFMGSMHIAIDTTAGERERRSLEPLLINPLPRRRIMAGKLAATTSYALVTLALALVSFILAMSLLPTARMDVVLNLDLAVALWIFVLVAPAALLAAALLTILAAFAKSFREAQSYVGLVILVPMVPSFWILIDPAPSETWMTLVPLLAQSVLILELVRGEPMNLLWAALTVTSTGLAALGLAAVAATLYGRPQLTVA